MNNSKPQLYFLLATLAVTSALAFFIFRPFLYVLALAMICAVELQPIYQKIVGLFRGRRGLSALTTILIVVVVIVALLVVLGVQVFQEAQQLYSSIVAEGDGHNAVFSIPSGLVNSLQEYFPVTQGFYIDVDQYLKQGLSWLLQHLDSVFGSFIKIVTGLFLFMIALYYLLKDGPKLKAAIIALSPLSHTNDEIIFQKLSVAINSIMKGSFLIALIQGALTSVGFAVFGVPNAILWGSLTAVAALIPGIGTALVITPAILFLFFKGEVFAGLGLTVWGMGAVGLIDNFLGPKLIGHDMRLHPLIILLSALGGIVFFGPIGFLLGPITMSLLFVLVDIYSSLMAEKELDV